MENLHLFSKSPDEGTVFLPISQIEEFCQDGFECCAIVFSPTAEGNHFGGCPPYISLIKWIEGNPQYQYFEVPQAIAHFGSSVAGYTRMGGERMALAGRQQLQSEIRLMLGINLGSVWR